MDTAGLKELQKANDDRAKRDQPRVEQGSSGPGFDDAGKPHFAGKDPQPEEARHDRSEVQRAADRARTNAANKPRAGVQAKNKAGAPAPKPDFLKQ